MNLFRKPHLGTTLLCLAAAIGALFLAQLPNDTRSDWFRTLNRPDLLPRELERKIGFIWTTIFLLAGLGTAQSLAAEQSRPRKFIQVGLIGFCLLLNLTYTYVFTYRHDLFLATGIAALLAIILLLLLIAVSRSRLWIAFACHAPHLGWVCFATYVTLRMAELNPGT